MRDEAQATRLEPIQPACPADGPGGMDVCPVCGGTNPEWKKCKQICLTCNTILRTCADL